MRDLPQGGGAAAGGGQPGNGHVAHADDDGIGGGVGQAAGVGDDQGKRQRGGRGGRAEGGLPGGGIAQNHGCAANLHPTVDQWQVAVGVGAAAAVEGDEGADRDALIRPGVGHRCYVGDGDGRRCDNVSCTIGGGDDGSEGSGGGIGVGGGRAHCGATVAKGPFINHVSAFRDGGGEVCYLPQGGGAAVGGRRPGDGDVQGCDGCQRRVIGGAGIHVCAADEGRVGKYLAVRQAGADHTGEGDDAALAWNQVLHAPDVGRRAAGIGDGHAAADDAGDGDADRHGVGDDHAAGPARPGIGKGQGVGDRIAHRHRRGGGRFSNHQINRYLQLEGADIAGQSAAARPWSAALVGNGRICARPRVNGRAAWKQRVGPGGLP